MSLLYGNGKVGDTNNMSDTARCYKEDGRLTSGQGWNLGRRSGNARRMIILVQESHDCDYPIKTIPLISRLVGKMINNGIWEGEYKDYVREISCSS